VSREIRNPDREHNRANHADRATLRSDVDARVRAGNRARYERGRGDGAHASSPARQLDPEVSGSSPEKPEEPPRERSSRGIGEVGGREKRETDIASERI